MERNNWIRQLWIIIAIVLLVFFLVHFCSNSETQQQRNFAQLVLKYAYEMKKTTGLPASITSAIAILESGWGKHCPIDWKTGECSNNYFGIKSDGTQPYVESYTYEYYNGKYIRILAKFRKYNSLLESLIDYGNFIYENERYARAVANKDNPIVYIRELQKAGYATGKNYAKKVLKIAEQCKFLTISKWEK